LTLREAFQKLKRGGDATLALQLHNRLRFQRGWTYRDCVHAYAMCNEMDEHEALSEWDEHMLAAEKIEPTYR
jgi:hypothetical protein